jgi:hypothetical protein
MIGESVDQLVRARLRGNGADLQVERIAANRQPFGRNPLVAAKRRIASCQDAHVHAARQQPGRCAEHDILAAATEVRQKPFVRQQDVHSHPLRSPGRAPGLSRLAAWLPSLRRAASQTQIAPTARVVH